MDHNVSLVFFFFSFSLLPLKLASRETARLLLAVLLRDRLIQLWTPERRRREVKEVQGDRTGMEGKMRKVEGQGKPPIAGLLRPLCLLGKRTVYLQSLYSAVSLPKGSIREFLFPK